MKIKISRILVRAIIGLNDWERKKKQDIIIDISLTPARETATQSDNIEESINYRTITKKVISEVEKSQFLLVERLSGFIMDILFENPEVVEATVSVTKPHVVRFAESVSVELTRKR